MKESKALKKLNIGCGKNPLPGFVNLDISPLPGVDVVFDLETCGKPSTYIEVARDGSEAPVAKGPPIQMPFPDNHFDRMIMSHVFEHITNTLGVMDELWRIAKPGCKLAILTPYGSSDNAWEDPTHVRPIFKNTYIYFTPLAYGRADYGVKGDWHYNYREFKLDRTFFSEDADDMQLGLAVATMRNVVKEFAVELVAVKPPRKIEPGMKDPDPPRTAFRFV